MQSRISDPIDIDPALPEEIIDELTPCLALVSGSGMDTAAKRVWYAAAVKALHGLPIALVKRGAEAALRTADHPSKIVPAIIRDAEESMRLRRMVHKSRLKRPTALPTRDVVAEAERAEVGKLMKGLADRLSRKAEQP